MNVELEAGIVALDGAALASFYAQALAFVQEELLEFPQGTVHRLCRGSARLKIFQPTEGATDPGSLDPWHRDRGFAYAALHVDDAEQTVEAAVAGGAAVLTPVTAHRPGARYALLADPEGNVWEILEEQAPT